MRSNIGPMVDELGRIQAQMADLAERSTAIKQELAEAGQGQHDGKLFRATVSKYDRDQLDMEAVRAKLSPQFIARHTTSKPVISVRVVARTAKQGKAA